MAANNLREKGQDGESARCYQSDCVSWSQTWTSLVRFTPGVPLRHTDLKVLRLLSVRSFLHRGRLPAFRFSLSNHVTNVFFANVVKQRKVSDFSIDSFGQHAPQLLAGDPAFRNLVGFSE